MTLLIFIWALFSWLTFMRAFWFMVCPPNPAKSDIHYRLLFASYDCWIGCYVTGAPYQKKAYWFPIPLVGLKMWHEAGEGNDG
jgi:hypothetical protein